MKTPRVTSSRRRRKGQSTVEFALMMPVIMAFFFWIFEANIYWIGLHQGAYAAYAASRAHLVSGGPTQVRPRDAVADIMTGRLWRDGDFRPEDRVSTSTLRGGGGPDGVIVQLPSLSSLPFSRGFLSVQTEVSTHLGWSEFDSQKYRDRDRDLETGRRQMVTDNNLTDY